MTQTIYKKTLIPESEGFDKNAEYVTVAEYIRRKHAAALLKNPLANPLWASSISGAMKRGDIVPYVQGGFKFIDWNKYKDIVFRQYGQMPVKKVNKK